MQLPDWLITAYSVPFVVINTTQPVYQAMLSVQQHPSSLDEIFLVIADPYQGTFYANWFNRLEITDFSLLAGQLALPSVTYIIDTQTKLSPANLEEDILTLPEAVVVVLNADKQVTTVLFNPSASSKTLF